MDYIFASQMARVNGNYRICFSGGKLNSYLVSAMFLCVCVVMLHGVRSHRRELFNMLENTLICFLTDEQSDTLLSVKLEASRQLASLPQNKVWKRGKH